MSSSCCCVSNYEVTKISGKKIFVSLKNNELKCKTCVEPYTTIETPFVPGVRIGDLALTTRGKSELIFIAKPLNIEDFNATMSSCIISKKNWKENILEVLNSISNGEAVSLFSAFSIQYSILSHLSNNTEIFSPVISSKGGGPVSQFCEMLSGMIKLTTGQTELIMIKWINEIFRPFKIIGLSKSEASDFFKIQNLKNASKTPQSAIDSLVNAMNDMINSPEKLIFINPHVAEIIMSTLSIQHTQMTKIAYSLSTEGCIPIDKIPNFNSNINHLKSIGMTVFTRPCGQKFAYSSSYDRAESEVAKFISKCFDGEYEINRPHEEAFSIECLGVSECQESAIKSVVAMSGIPCNLITVITGGPGTGKTTTLKEIVNQIRKGGSDFRLTSFTGKAVSRIREKTDCDQGLSATIDALIARCDLNNYEHLIIDEASMVTVELFAKYLSHRSPNAKSLKLTLIGDADQLPPISGGNLFEIALRIPWIRKHEFKKNFRTDKAPRLLETFEAVRSGNISNLTQHEHFEIIHSSNPIEVSHKAANGDIILATHNSDVNSINMISTGSHKSEKKFSVGDYIMVTKNFKLSTDCRMKSLMNGDTGIVTGVDKFGVNIEFIERGQPVSIIVPRENTDECISTDYLTHAFSITIHKAQGSEYDRIVVLLRTKCGDFINRQLLYTAITRARSSVTIVTDGTMSDLHKIIETPIKKRFGNLAWRTEMEISKNHSSPIKHIETIKIGEFTSAGFDDE